MKIGINVSINVTKILKERLINGKKGIYLDLSGFIDLDNVDQYGNNGFVSQSTTKEERAAGLQTPILGNAKVFYNDSHPSPKYGPQPVDPQMNQKQPNPMDFQAPDDLDQPIPF